VSGRDLYEVLGVSRDADAAEIRRAFRRKVRRIHPDVAANKEAAHLAFIELREAYATLSDTGKRLLYDLSITPAAVAETVAEPEPVPGIDDLLKSAARDVEAGHYDAARRTLKDIFARDEENPDATLLLVRIMQATRSGDRALMLLEAAVSRFPTHPGLRTALNEARKAKAAQPVVRVSPRQRKSALRLAVAGAGVVASGVLLANGLVAKGAPLVWLPVLNDVPWSLVRGVALSGLVLGASGTVAGVFPALENDLLWPSRSGCDVGRYPERWEEPIGVVLPLMALLNWFAALVVWIMFAIARGVFSKSLAAAFGISAVLAGVAALAQPDAAVRILAWLPGWALAAVLTGRLLGDFFRP
jgi:glycosyltransferase involved in cell wall biosynthesis